MSLSKSFKMVIIRSLFIFFIAGLCEIGGGYMVWLWLRENKPWWGGVSGGVMLFLYGAIATFQPANFGRVYAAYGGVFIIMAMLWGWKADQIKPDKYDLIGAGIVLGGMWVMTFAPRK
jgi:small multidrug resistance family-3 protein